jgi:hypothetical protein
MRSSWESIDTTLPTGKLLFQLTGAFAEFERSMFRQHVRAGLSIIMPLASSQRASSILSGSAPNRPSRRRTLPALETNLPWRSSFILHNCAGYGIQMVSLKDVPHVPRASLPGLPSSLGVPR